MFTSNKMILSAICVLLMAGACSVKEDDFLPLGGEQQELVFTAESGEVDTKTAFQADETSIWWSPSDAICIYYGASAGSKFTSTNDTEVAKAEFHGTLNAFTGVTETGDFNKFWAVYPYTSGVSCDGNSVVATVASTQTAKDGSFANKTNVAIASSNGLALSFYNLCSWFRFSVTKEGIKSVTFRGSNNEDIAGSVRVAMDENGKPRVLEVVDGVKEITLKAPSGSTLEVGKMYYITLLPQTFTQGFTVTFNTLTQTGSRSITRESTYIRSLYNTGKNFDKDVVYSDIGGGNNPNNITFADEKVKAKLVAAFDTDDDGELSYAEAAAVSNAAQLKSAFGAIKTYKSFDEFQYFTGITSIPDNMFEDWVLFTSVILPDGIKSIGGSAFKGCTKLTSVLIPDGVTSIGNRAFEGCTGLTSFNIPESVSSIGNSAFYGCTGLTSITIPESVSSIGNSAFYGCTGLTSITIPESVTSIGGWAFYGCTGLTSITIPESVTSIGGWAFSGCTSLTSVIIPGSVSSISDYAFYGCTGLTSITIPESVTSIGGWAFYGCTGLTSISIPESVTSIGQSAFESCTGLTSVILPESVTSIGNSAFRDCSSLTSVTIPESVTSIGGWAFYGCTGLTSISIPESVTSIGQSAFESCTGLTSVILPESVTSIGNSAFEGCTGLTSITIPESVTSIGGWAFSGCTSLTSVIISEGVKSIGPNAFQDCTGLTSVVIPDSVTDISGAFHNCTGLTSITLLEGVTNISGAFSGCTGLTSVILPESVTDMVSAFSCCTGLTSITVLATVVPSGSSDMFYNTNSCPIYVPAGSVNAYKTAEYWSDYASRIQAIP